MLRPDAALVRDVRGSASSCSPWDLHSAGGRGIVRHPIYTGILLAVYATAAAKGTIPGVLGALLVTLGLWMKARLEERWLREELDPGAYDDYRRKVPMLVPFGPR